MTDSDLSKILSGNLEEANVLGCLVKSKMARRHLGDIDISFFRIPLHQEIFSVIQEMDLHGMELTADSFRTQFKMKNPITPFENFMGYLRLVDDRYFPTYLAQLKELSIRRHAVETSLNVHKLIVSGASVDEISNLLFRANQQIGTKAIAGTWLNSHDLMNNVTNRILKNQEEVRYTTGIEEVDKHGGYGKINLYIAARYGTGKTPFALRFPVENAVKKGIPTAIWSGENDNEELMIGMIAMVAKVSFVKLKDNYTTLTDSEKERVREAQKKIMNAPIDWLPWGRTTLHKLKAMYERSKDKNGTEIFILDQLPHIEQDTTFKNRNDAYDYMADTIFSWKKSIPGLWIILNQLKVTNDPKNPPCLEDGKWFKRAEENCDVGVVLRRPSKEKARLERIQKEMDDKRRLIILDKSIPPNERDAYIQEMEESYNWDDKAIISQQKGRLGYGEWEETVGFDPDGQGYHSKGEIFYQEEEEF